MGRHLVQLLSNGKRPLRVGTSRSMGRNLREKLSGVGLRGHRSRSRRYWIINRGRRIQQSFSNNSLNKVNHLQSKGAISGLIYAAGVAIVCSSSLPCAAEKRKRVTAREEKGLHEEEEVHDEVVSNVLFPRSGRADYLRGTSRRDGSVVPCHFLARRGNEMGAAFLLRPASLAFAARGLPL